MRQPNPTDPVEGLRRHDHHDEADCGAKCASEFVRRIRGLRNEQLAGQHNCKVPIGWRIGRRKKNARLAQRVPTAAMVAVAAENQFRGAEWRKAISNGRKEKPATSVFAGTSRVAIAGGGP